LDEAGTQFGVMSRSDAMSKASELNVDLVEIGPGANPPVAKLIDYNKLVYQLNKKKRAAKTTKSGDVKEVWLTPFIAEHDMQARASRGRELLDETGKLKVVMRFRRPQMSRREFGVQTMQKFLKALGEIALDKPPHFEGMRLIAGVSKK
jgi:translation initiation factor IF-3